MQDFEVKAYPEMWQALDMDVARFDKARQMLGGAYAKIFLSQANRPQKMAYFDAMISEIFGGRVQELVQAKKEGRPVVGTFCVYIPEEIVVAADGICVGLCGGSPGSIPDAEKILPRNICPMVKSAFGFKAGRICPYFQVVDFVYGETTCDAKKTRKIEHPIRDDLQRWQWICLLNSYYCCHCSSQAIADAINDLSDNIKMLDRNVHS